MSLDPLKFQVAIQDDATKQLSSIETALNSLKDKTISVKVEGLSDLQQLLSALQHQQVSNLGKDVGSAINEATKNLQNEAQNAIRTSLGNLARDLVSIKEAIQHDNFTAFSKRIETCAAAVDTLDAAFKKFHVTIGQDEGMRNFMSGLGEVIRNVRSTVGMLNGGMSGASATPDAMSRSVKVARHEMERLNNDLVRAQRNIETFGDKGFNVSSLERYKTALIEVRENLRLIERNGGVHPITGLTASQYLSSEDASRVVSLLKTELSYYNNIRNELDRIAKLRSTLSSILNANPSTPFRSELANAMAGLDLREGLLARQGARDAMQTLNSASYRTQITEAVSLISKVSSESRQAEKNSALLVESMRRAGIAVSDLAAKFDKLEIAKIRANAVDAKVDTSAYDKAVERMERYRRVLEYISQNGGHDSSRITGSVGYRNASNDLNIQAAALKALTKEANSASYATNHLSAEQQRLAQALETSTNKLHGQSQVLSDLKSLATQYLGVWGGQQFLNNIIQIGGQLEMQRLSIGAILQNQAQANDLFNKIKGLATQSPFGVVELDQMTKQLTAYGFKYNELYDMTKRLADISAATGTGVDRLALALGHVRSEAALSGYTLRQFAMGNVPMLQKLSEKLGKSTEEIRKMVRSKQISYDDVVGVLKDLTDEGGMFYNMQEVISQSVKAKFKNVRDAMDIMYGEMAEGSIGDALKEVADVLMDVTRNWKDVATVVGSVTGVWVTHRAAILAMNAALGSNTASVTANILSYKQKRAIELQNEALTRKLTAEELALVATRKTITAENIRVAMSTNAITKGEALRLVGLRKLSLEEAKALIRSGEFTAAEVRMAMQGRVLGMNLGYAGNMMRYLATSAKMMMAALLTNPWTWIMAGVTTVIELWQRNSREMEQAEELSNKIYEHSQEALKNTRQMLQDTGIKVEWRNKDKDSFSDVTSNFGRQLGGQIRFSLPEFDTSNAKESIERWTQYIRDYAATPNRLLNEALFDEAGNVRALKDQFDNLKVAVEEVAVAQEQLRSLGDIFENAVNATNSGWFDDSVLTNISDYDKTLRSFGNNIATTYKKFRVNIDIALQSARQQDSEFDKAASGMATYAQQLDLLVRNQEKYAKASEVFRNANTISRAAMNELFGDHIVGDAGAANVEAQKATMMADLETFYVQLQADLETKGIKIGSMSEAQQQALLLGYKDKLSSIQGLSVETSNFLMKEFAKRFGIEIDVDDEKFRVKEKEIIRILKELSESDWNVEMNFATNVKDVIDEAQKQYKAAKEYFEKVKPIMLKLGVEFEAGKMLTDEQIEAAVAKADPKARDFIRQALKGVNEATKVYNNAMNASKAGGFSLEDNKKKKTPGERKSEDKDARRLREIVKLYKDAYDWYTKYEKQVGEGSALTKVKEQFQPLFDEFRNQWKQSLSLDSIPEYKQNLETLLSEAQKLYESPKHKNSYMVEAIKTIRDAINNVDYEEAQRKMDEYASKVQIELDGLTRKWDMFNDVREATGNIELAVRISGVGGDGTRNLADDLRKKIQTDLAQIGVNAIPFDFNFSDKDIKKEVENAFESFKPQKPTDENDKKAMKEYNDKLSEYQSKIKGFIEIYKKWRDLQRDVTAKDLKIFADLLGKTEDYGSKLNQLRNKLSQTLDSISLSNGSQEDKNLATRRAVASEEWEEAQLSADFANLFNNAVSMSKNAFESEASYIEGLLNDLFELGLISPEKMNEWRDKVTKARSDYSTSGFLGIKGSTGAFLAGGYQGLIDYRKSKRNNIKEDLSRLDPKSKEYKDKEKELKIQDKLIEKNEKAAKSMEQVMNAANTLKGGFDLLSDHFSNMGATGMGDAMSDASGVLGSAMSGASSLSALGPYGMAAGAGLGLVSGLFALHDKAIQREIDALKENNEAIEANTDAILRYRQRTLGYDTGEVRKSLANNYKDTKKIHGLFSVLNGRAYYVDDDAKRAMQEYYKRNSIGTGYKQELANLKEERENYLKMYNLESDKKNVSNESLQEYKKKIAELDEQIMYFTEDIANELWGIDLKGWADQLSDSLWTAFENGEDAVKAFHETAKDIISDVAKRMMNIHLIEPVMSKLEDALFGKMGADGKRIGGGAYNMETGQFNEKETLEILGNFFGEDGEFAKVIESAETFYDMAKRVTGFDFGSDSGGSVSSGIKGVTEQTTDLLASYVNSIRADVSVNRAMIAQYFPMYYQALTSGNDILRGIENHTAAIMQSNEAIEKSNQAILDRIDGLRNNTWRVPVE